MKNAAQKKSGNKNLWSKIFLVQKNCWSKRILGLKSKQKRQFCVVNFSMKIGTPENIANGKWKKNEYDIWSSL